MGGERKRERKKGEGGRKIAERGGRGRDLSEDKEISRARSERVSGRFRFKRSTLLAVEPNIPPSLRRSVPLSDLERVDRARKRGGEGAQAGLQRYPLALILAFPSKPLSRRPLLPRNESVGVPRDISWTRWGWLAERLCSPLLPLLLLLLLLLLYLLVSRDPPRFFVVCLFAVVRRRTSRLSRRRRRRGSKCFSIPWPFPATIYRVRRTCGSRGPRILTGSL